MNPVPLLQPYTETELQRLERTRKATDAAQAQHAAAPPPCGFTLTGSDRPTDVATAHGQKELFK